MVFFIKFAYKINNYFGVFKISIVLTYIPNRFRYFLLLSIKILRTSPSKIVQFHSMSLIISTNRTSKLDISPINKLYKQLFECDAQSQKETFFKNNNT